MLPVPVILTLPPKLLPAFRAWPATKVTAYFVLPVPLAALLVTMGVLSVTSPSARKSINPLTPVNPLSKLKILLLTVNFPAVPALVVMLADTLPVPEIALLMVVLLVRTKLRLALPDKATAPAPNVPVVPALPICNVPPVTAVVPE